MFGTPEDMRFLVLFAALATTALGLLELPISMREAHSDGTANLLTRSVQIDKREVGTNVYDVLSWTYGGYFYTNVTVGTPPQELSVMVNTGTADFYFDAFCNLAQTDPHGCRGGTFNPAASTTYNIPNSTAVIDIVYVDDSTISGPIGSDVVGIGDVQISNVQFGVAENINFTHGYARNIMGLAYTNLQVVQNDSFYPSVPDVLVQSGVTNSRLFSMYLGGVVAGGTGSLLFGAIDNSKYTGNLATMNFLPGSYDHSIDSELGFFIVPVTGLALSTQGSDVTLFSGGPTDTSIYDDTTTGFPAALKTSATFSAIPSEHFDSIINAFSYIDENHTCSCSSPDPEDYLTWTFANKVKIRVNMSELIAPLIDPTTRRPVLYNGSETETTCALMLDVVDTSEWDFSYLSNSILQSMYMVYDLDNGQVSIAQAGVNVTDPPLIVEVPSGANGVASVGVNVVAAPSNAWPIPSMVTPATNLYSTSTAESVVGTATGLGAIPVSAQVSSSAISVAFTNQPTTDPTPSAGSPTPTGTSASSGSGGSNTGAIAGGVVGGVAGLALIGAAAFFFLRRRKAKARRPQMREVSTDFVGAAPEYPQSPPPPPMSPTPKSPTQKKFHIGDF